MRSVWVNECIPEKVSFNSDLDGWAAFHHRIGKEGLPRKNDLEQGPGDTGASFRLGWAALGRWRGCRHGWTYDLGHVTWERPAVSYWRHWGFNPSHGIAEAFGERDWEDERETQRTWWYREKNGQLGGPARGGCCLDAGTWPQEAVVSIAEKAAREVPGWQRPGRPGGESGEAGRWHRPQDPRVAGTLWDNLGMRSRIIHRFPSCP